MPENLGCTFDPAHTTYAEIAPAAVLKMVGNRVAHVHLHDAIKGNSMLAYRQGCINFAEIFTLLNHYNYQGKFSLEYHGSEDLTATSSELRCGLDYLRQQCNVVNISH